MENWQGMRHKKNKRGFKTKGSRGVGKEISGSKQQKGFLDINFENFVEIYLKIWSIVYAKLTIINKRLCLI